MSWPQVCLHDLNYIDAGSQNHCPKTSAVEVNNMHLYSKINFLGTNKYKMVDPTRCLGFKWDKQIISNTCLSLYIGVLTKKKMLLKHFENEMCFMTTNYYTSTKCYMSDQVYYYLLDSIEFYIYSLVEELCVLPWWKMVLWKWNYFYSFWNKILKLYICTNFIFFICFTL